MEGTLDTDSKKQGMRQLDSQKLNDACAVEVDSLEENKCYSMVNRPDNKTTVTTKWFFTNKRDAAGNVVKYMARVVNRGFMQNQGSDYQETFAPTVKRERIRQLLAIAASQPHAIPRSYALEYVESPMAVQEVAIDSQPALALVRVYHPRKKYILAKSHLMRKRYRC